MVRTVLTLLLLFTLTIPALAQTKQKPSGRSTEPSAAQKKQFADDQEAINELHAKDIEASIALDAARLETLWTDDIVTIHPGGPPVVGKEANIKKLRESINQMKNMEMVAYNEEFQEVNILGDLAYEWGVITGRTRPFSGGEEHSYKYNVMRVLKRQPDGTWRISRSIYNDAVPPPELKKDEQKKEPPKEDQNRLKD